MWRKHHHFVLVRLPHRVSKPANHHLCFFGKAKSLNSAVFSTVNLRADGSLRILLARLSRIDVLLIDDWAMAPLAETERRDFGEICEDRYQTRSTILTS